MRLRVRAVVALESVKVVHSKSIECPADGGTVARPFGKPTLMRDADFPVTNGLIYQFELYLPPGSSGLLYVRIADGGFPVWPSEPGEWFYGDNTLIRFPDRYFIAAPDHKFKIWYYNLDDTYAHVFTVRIGQVSAMAFISSFIPGYGAKDLEQVLKELKKEEEAARVSRVRDIEEYFVPVEREPLPSEEEEWR